VFFIRRVFFIKRGQLQSSLHDNVIGVVAELKLINE